MVNVQEYQIKSKEEEIYKELLSKGHNVSTYEVSNLLNNFFENNIAGLPYFKPIKIEAYSKSNKPLYDDMFYKINEDLSTIFNVYNGQSEYAVVTQSSYDLEIEEIHNELDKLILHTQILDEYSKRKNSYFPYVITYNSLENVNTKNLLENNVPYTTSEIDFNTSTLRNELKSTPNDKIDLSNSVIKIEAPSFRLTTNKKINNILTDSYTELVDITLAGTSKSKNASLTLTVTLPSSSNVSRVELLGYSLANTNIRLLISEDGENFLEKMITKGQNKNIWRFNKTSIIAVKIIIEKVEFDYQTESSKLFYYILKNLSMYNDKYSKYSVYTSNIIRFNNPISDVTLTPDQTKPYGTDITYFVGVENKDNNVEWKTIKEYEPLDIKLLNKENMLLNYYTSDIFGSWRFDRKLKEYSFYIHELPENTNLNSIYIRTGHSQWLIEKLDHSDKIENPKISTYDYNKSKVTDIAPLDATVMDIKCEDRWNYIVMSQYVICDRDSIVENRYIAFDKDKEIFEQMVLINGKQIFSKDGKFTFKLKTGENVVQILILLGELNVSNIATTKVIKHNFNLMAYCSEIYAGPKMQRLSGNSLMKNINKHSLKHYSVNTENGKDMVIVKYDPNYIIKPSDPLKSNRIPMPPDYKFDDVKMNNSEYFRVHLKYKNMSNETLTSITNGDGDNSIRLRVMAKLTTADRSVSPSINSIKVVAE